MRLRTPFLAAAAATTLLTAAPASAATFNVNTTIDSAAACAATCSIRGALVSAARNAGADTIIVPAGNYVLNQQIGGQLAVDSDVSIIGAGAATTTILGDGKNFRIVDVTGPGRQASISHVTLTFGTAATQPTGEQIGGIVLVDSGATLNLDHARVFNGQATRGAGIAIRGGTANITKSLVDDNRATQDGSGILNLGSSTPGVPITIAKLSLIDSTVTANGTPTSSVGPAAGVVSVGNAANSATVTRSTIANNFSGSNGGTGLRNTNGTMTVTGSIVAENRGAGTEDNCGGAITNGGGNVENFNSCGFALHDVPLAQLVSTTLTPAGETQVLTIPATSVAVDLAGACAGADQRDLSRPQGTACDAGAYEVDQPAMTQIDSGPSGTVSGQSASFTFSADEPNMTFECRLDGPQGAGAFGPCVSPANFGALLPGDYTFFLRATDAGGHQSTTTRTFSVAAVQAQTPTPTPTPTPVAGKSVVIQPVSGKTLVKLPGSSKFLPLDVTRGIPNGATVDTRKSKIRLYAIPKAGKPVENALFYDGIFKLVLSGGVIELRLVEQLAPCPKGRAASAAAKKPKTRKLWGDGSGSFRTRGQYSSATVRGTRWLVQDSCGKTLTRVAKGVVQVQDFVKRKKVLVRAPKSYIARKKR
ncbi:MAG TPA: choice-of-anchor Q domain-containing protein [Baekduia sp.]